MADKPPSTPPAGDIPMAGKAPTAKPLPAAKPPPEGNPAFRAMGLPNWRPKLPSRNWMIFLTIVGTWTGTYFYDRNQKKKAQQKWCTLVSHIAQEPLQTNMLARRVTVYLGAPPGDSLRTTREHFLEYVKPILVAAALDWDVVEGRREGEVRVGTAERIRRYRRRHGEQAETPEEQDFVMVLEDLRGRIGVQDWSDQKGNIVIGRHTWKEYIRGLHEGWLGPLDAPKPPPTIIPPTPATTEDEASPSTLADPSTPSSTPSDSDSSPTTPPTTSDPKPTEEKKPAADEPPPKPQVPPPYNTPASYATSTLPSSIPSELSASNPIPFPHILGFVNTPQRVYRFLTRRYLADEIGRQTAAIVLAHHRSYHQSAGSSFSEPSTSTSASTSDFASASTTTTSDSDAHATIAETWEQQALLRHEEREWTKQSRKRTDGEGERVLLDDMVIDPRIGGRMRRFELGVENEERARRIGRGIAGIPGRRAGDVKEEGE